MRQYVKTEQTRTACVHEWNKVSWQSDLVEVLQLQKGKLSSCDTAAHYCSLSLS